MSTIINTDFTIINWCPGASGSCDPCGCKWNTYNFGVTSAPKPSWEASACNGRPFFGLGFVVTGTHLPGDIVPVQIGIVASGQWAILGTDSTPPPLPNSMGGTFGLPVLPAKFFFNGAEILNFDITSATITSFLATRSGLNGEWQGSTDFPTVQHFGGTMWTGGWEANGYMTVDAIYLGTPLNPYPDGTFDSVVAPFNCVYPLNPSAPSDGNALDFSDPNPPDLSPTLFFAHRYVFSKPFFDQPGVWIQTNQDVLLGKPSASLSSFNSSNGQGLQPLISLRPN
jgi:hypothetical protein